MPLPIKSQFALRKVRVSLEESRTLPGGNPKNPKTPEIRGNNSTQTYDKNCLLQKTASTDYVFSLITPDEVS
jgi:hypothetical protein